MFGRFIVVRHGVQAEVQLRFFIGNSRSRKKAEFDLCLIFSSVWHFVTTLFVPLFKVVVSGSVVQWLSGQILQHGNRDCRCEG